MRVIATIAYLSAGVGALASSQHNYMAVCGHGAPAIDGLLIVMWPGQLIYEAQTDGATPVCRNQ